MPGVFHQYLSLLSILGHDTVPRETVTVVGDCCTTDGTDLPAPVELLAGAEPLGVDAFTGRSGSHLILVQ